MRADVRQDVRPPALLPFLVIAWQASARVLAGERVCRIRATSSEAEFGMTSAAILRFPTDAGLARVLMMTPRTGRLAGVVDITYQSAEVRSKKFFVATAPRA